MARQAAKTVKATTKATRDAVRHGNKAVQQTAKAARATRKALKTIEAEQVHRPPGQFVEVDGATLARRLSAVDARDGRAVAATADVDRTYPLGHQLYVQPSERLQECFGAEEPIRMTRQEVAVAQSHVEVWKAVASGPHSHVLVIEGDVWFKPGAAAAIDRGWRAARERCRADGDRTCSISPTRTLMGPRRARTFARRCSDPCAGCGSSRATFCPARVERSSCERCPW